MAMQGTNLGPAFYEVLPDLDSGKFVAAGVLAGAALAGGINSALGKSLGAANNAVMQSFGGLGRAASGAAGVASTALQSVGAVASGLGSAFVGVGSRIWSAMNHASDALRSLASHVGIASFQLQILGAMLTSIVTGPLFAAGIGLSKWGIQTAMVIEDATVGLRALLPAGYDVEALVERLKVLAISSPVFAVDQLFDFTRKLVGAGIEGAKSEKILDSLNKVFITYGVTGEKASKALLGVGQVFSKGKVQAEELTGQIGEQIPIWHLLSEASGISQAKLMELSKSGDFTAEAFAEMIIKVGDLPKVMEGAEQGVTTLSAQISILKESVQQTLAVEFLKYFPDIKQAIDRLTPSLNLLVAIFVSKLPLVISLLSRMIDKFFEIREMYNSLNPKQQEWIKTIATFLPVAGPALLVLGGIATGLSTILGFASILINPWAALLSALGGGLAYLYKNSEDFRLGIESFRTSFATAFGAEMPGAVQRLKDAFLNDLVPAFQALLAALGFPTFQDFGAWLGGAFAQGAVGGVDLLAAAVRGLASGINFLSEKMPIIRQQFQEFRDLLSDLKDKWDGLTDSQQKAVLIMAGAALTAVVGLNGSLSTAIGLVWGLVSGLIGVGGGLAGALSAIASPAGVAVLAIGGLSGALVFAAAKSEDLRSLAGDMGREFKDGLSESLTRYAAPALGDLRDAFADLTPALENLAHALGFKNLKEAAGFFGEYLGFLAGVVLKIGSLYLKFITFMINIWAVGVRAIKQRMQNAIDSINIGVIGPYNWLVGLGVFGPTRATVAEIKIPGWLMNEPSSNAVSEAQAEYNRLNIRESWSGMARGGLVMGPGTGTSDSILRALSNGEFVNTAASTKIYRSTLEAMNAGASPEVVRATLPSTRSLASVSSGPSGASGQPVSVTVYVGNELLVNQMEAVVDANNRATINVMRSGRRPV